MWLIASLGTEWRNSLNSKNVVCRGFYCQIAVRRKIKCVFRFWNDPVQRFGGIAHVGIWKSSILSSRHIMPECTHVITCMYLILMTKDHKEWGMHCILCDKNIQQNSLPWLFQCHNQSKVGRQRSDRDHLDCSRHRFSYANVP